MFRRTRYASEFGYQSFPALDLINTVYSEQDKHWYSNMMYHRQHHPHGQNEIPHLIGLHLPLPANFDTLEFFPYMLYLNQVEQSVAQKSQAEWVQTWKLAMWEERDGSDDLLIAFSRRSYRRLSDKLDYWGHGHNRGALYWQLNDIWPGASWASVRK